MEWTALFLGERDEKWLTIHVDNLWIPDSQIRGRGHIRIPDDWNPPDHIAPDIVGIVHLHPGFHYRESVGFSSVDTGTGGLNERWRMSMVIGRTLNDKDLESYILGISYKILGRCTLPCGALGTIEYFLHPAINGEPDPEWPFRQEVVEPEIVDGDVDAHPRVAIGIEHPDLKDCARYIPSEGSTRYIMKRQSVCGLKETQDQLQHAVFGATGEGIIHQLPQIVSQETTIQPYKGKGKNGRENYRSYSDEYEYRDGVYLPGWSEV